MQIPEVFFGKKTEVRNNLNIIANKILKNTLEEQFSTINCIDTNVLNEFIIHYNVGSYYEKIKNCFYLSELTKLLFFSDRFSGEEMHKIRDENIEYLSKTAWGNLIINNGQNYFFINDHEYDYNDFYSKHYLNRKRCIIILKGIIEFYDEYEKIKDNFYHPNVYPCEKFPNISMLYHYVLGNCSIDRIENKDYKMSYDLNTIIEIYNKINDDDYWNRLSQRRDEKETIRKKLTEEEREKNLKKEIEWYKNELKKKPTLPPP